MEKILARETYRLEKQEEAKQDVLENAGQGLDYFVGNAANHKIKGKAECPVYREELKLAQKDLLAEQKENRQKK